MSAPSTTVQRCSFVISPASNSLTKQIVRYPLPNSKYFTGTLKAYDTWQRFTISVNSLAVINVRWVYRCSHHLYYYLLLVLRTWKGVCYVYMTQYLSKTFDLDSIHYFFFKKNLMLGVGFILIIYYFLKIFIDIFLKSLSLNYI